MVATESRHTLEGGGGKVPARGKPLGRRMVDGNGTKERGNGGHGMPGQGTKGDAMASRGRKEGEGMVAAVLLFSAALSKRPLAVSSHTRQ